MRGEKSHRQSKIPKGIWYGVSFFTSLLIGIFAMSVFSAKSVPTTEEDAQEIPVNYVSDAMEVHMASAEPVYTSDTLSFQEFNAVGLQWEGVHPDLVEFEVRIKGKDGWTDWIHTPSMTGEGKDGDALSDFSTFLLFEQGNKVEFRLFVQPETDRAPEISNVKVITLNTEAPIKDGFTKMASTVQGQSLDIITRAQWGANESYRYTDGELDWPIQKSTWRKYIIHHTAGSTGGSDPAAVVRAIYYYHAKTLGWGDIGYNFLVDAEGRIYQGRYGGDDVIGAHAYNNVTDTSYNVGTMGVSVMGCYETASGACSTVHTFNSDQLNALGKVIGYKAGERGIDPKGSSEYAGEIIKNVLGHEDVDYTYCPGNRIGNMMPDIRTKAAAYAAKVDVDTSRIEWDGEYLGNDYPDAIFTNDRRELKVRFRNTGTRTWYRGKIFLKLYDGSGSGASPFKDSSWGDNYYGMMYLDQASVAPGETGTFTFTVQAPENIGRYSMIMKLAQRKYPFPSDYGLLKARVDATLMGKYDGSTLPPAILPVWRPETTMYFRNQGIEPWNERVEVWVNNRYIGRLSGWTPQWHNTSITFRFTPPQEKGLQYFPVELRRDGKVVQGTRRYVLIRVD